ncbi:MAG TPA: fatty acid desaturase [Trebonia sp.]|nr:fatty acid desaturase [Trebonia sp.]
MADLIVLAWLTTFNTIVLSHLFIHRPWFASDRLNTVISTMNSVSIAGSVTVYRFMHVRNHHRYSNDRRGSDGSTLDLASTYRNGKDGGHQPLIPYVFTGVRYYATDLVKEVLGVRRLWKVGPGDETILSLATSHEPRRHSELRQIRVERAAHCIMLLLFTVISWQWALFCCLPALVITWTLANIQNYYRHYGANPDERAANSVSYYGRLYNLLTFNDGYHQEHHLAPGVHWSALPAVRDRQRAEMAAHDRIVSPVPAVLGFMDRNRKLLHEQAGLEAPQLEALDGPAGVVASM